MIKNFEELATSEAKGHLLSILEEGLSKAMPEKAVKSTLSFDGNALRVMGKKFPIRGKLVVIGFGKASVRMGKVVEEILGEAIDEGIIISPFKSKLDRIDVCLGTHPLPTKRNVESAKKIADLVKGLKEDDTVLVLISGGGSALFSLPVDEVSVEEKAQTSQLLMKAGANIYELNAVRKHLSKVKGGRLSKLAWPATVISLIISDVVGDRLDTIASGPTSPDETTFTDALDAVHRRRIKVPKTVVTYLKKGVKGKVEETPKPGDPIFEKTYNFIIASNLRSLKAMKDKAEELGYSSMLLSSRIVGEAREVAKALASILLSCKLDKEPMKPPVCLIAGGETTVTVKGKGVGGRNQELALSAAIEIEGFEDILLASIGSDGIDGTSDAAGALIDGLTAKKAKQLGLDPRKFLEDNDSYNFFRKVGGAIYTGITGTNVNDFIAGLVL